MPRIFNRRALLALAPLLALAGSLSGCAMSYDGSVNVGPERDVQVIVTGSNPSVELSPTGDATEPFRVIWKRPSLPDESQIVQGFVGRTIRGGGELRIESDKPAEIHLRIRRADGVSVTSPAPKTESKSEAKSEAK